MSAIKEIQCLYLEDNPEDRKTYKRILEDAWERQDRGIPIYITTVEDPETAIQMITSNVNKYHLFVCDILFGTDNEQLGLETIASARRSQRNLSILAFSVADGNFSLQARESGADDFYPKSSIAKIDNKLTILGTMIYTILTKHEHEPIISSIIPEYKYLNDLPLKMVLKSIGVDNVGILIAKVLKKPCKDITPYFVKSGLSGAFMLRVDCDLEVEKDQVPISRSLLLKISKDKNLLSNEFNKREEISSFPPNLFISFMEGKLENSGAWYTITADTLIVSNTLIDWILEKDTNIKTITQLLNILFLGGSGLSNVYNRVIRKPDIAPNVAIWNNLDESRKARIQLACYELKSLIKRHDKANIFDLKTIDNFIGESKRIVNSDEEIFDFGTCYCLSHGDLHGRNILVDDNNIPRLIDPANIGKLHWASDIARLCVDLIVSGWDYGFVQHEWDEISGWLELSSSFVNGTIIPYNENNKSNKRIHCVLKWIRDNMNRIHINTKNNPKPEWEFKLALAVEFMRSAYRYRELPSPKRVFGLIAACDALRQTEKEHNEFVRRKNEK